MIPLLLAPLLLVPLLPWLAMPPAGASREEVARLIARYWALAAHGGATKEQTALWERLHVLGVHLDEDHEGCSMDGFLGKWRIFLARIGLVKVGVIRDDGA